MNKLLVFTVLLLLAALLCATVWFVGNTESDTQNNTHEIAVTQTQIKDLEQQIVELTQRVASYEEQLNQQIVELNTQAKAYEDQLQKLVDTIADSESQQLQMGDAVDRLYAKLRSLENRHHKHIYRRWLMIADYNRKDGGWTLHN